MGTKHRFGANDQVISVNNIQRLREHRGWSRPELGVRMGTSGQQIERLEKGLRQLSQKWIDSAAKAFGVEPSKIISPIKLAPRPARGEPTLRSDHSPTRSVDAGEAVPITALDLSLSMGPGTLIEEFVESEPVLMDLALVQAITRTPSDRLRMVRGIGHSMEPTLRTEDRVLIDINERAMTRVGGVYWIDYHGAHGIKRLRPAGKDRILVMSDNPVEPDFEVAANELRIEGRAIWFARGL